MTAKNLGLLFFSVLLGACASRPAADLREAPPGYVLHPAPTEPKFIAAGLYLPIKAKLTPPPAPSSTAQKNDERTLLALQAGRTPEACAAAAAEVGVSLESFFGPPAGILSAAEVKRLEPFMLQVRNDADYFIQRLKIDFPRQRPFLYVPGLEPCVLKEVTGAYPSGHAAISRLQALILSRLYPERSQALFARARAIGQSRVLSGMHHPSDIRAGEELAEKLYGEFGKSESFQRALRALEQRPF